MDGEGPLAHFLMSETCLMYPDFRLMQWRITSLPSMQFQVLFCYSDDNDDDDDDGSMIKE